MTESVEYDKSQERKRKETAKEVSKSLVSSFLADVGILYHGGQPASLTANTVTLAVLAGRLML